MSFKKGEGAEMKTFKNENGTIFTEIEDWKMAVLKNITPEDVFVSKTNIEIIKNILTLHEVSNDELVGMRNYIVKTLSKIKSSMKECSKERMDMITRISMITAVIDNEKWDRGMEV